MSGEFDHRAISAEDYRQMIASAIAKAEIEGAIEILTVMVSVHPREAVEVYDDIQAALRLRRMLS